MADGCQYKTGMQSCPKQITHYSRDHIEVHALLFCFFYLDKIFPLCVTILLPDV